MNINRKVLLVAVNAKYIHSNLAVYSLYAYAEEYQEHIEIVEYTINHSTDEILRDIYLRKPDIIAFSCYIWNISIIEIVIGELFKLLPEVSIWLGGPEASYRTSELLHSYSHLSGIMVGEGEQSFYQLMEYYIEQKGSLSNIKGIHYLESGEMKENDSCEVLDLSSLPFPYQAIQEQEPFERFANRILYYESSRGCPFSCSYCLSSIDKKLRFRKLEQVKKELQFFLDHNVKQVKFVDRTFNCKREYATEIWKYLKDHDNGITNFHFEIAADLITEEQLRLLKTIRSGLIQFEIGVQSVNQQTIQAIHRTMNLERLKKVASEIYQTRKIHQHLDLIAGLPFENYKSFQNSFNVIFQMKPDQLQLGFLKVLRGTDMWDRQEDYGIAYQSNPPYEVLFTKWLTYEDILKLKGIEEMVEVYYNSLQFTYSIQYLANIISDPFSLFEMLFEYYEKKELIGVKYSRLDRYEILREFAQDNLDREQFYIFTEILIYDIYLREKVKSKPYFMEDRNTENKVIRRFYSKEAQERRYLPDYMDYDGKQLSRMTHLECFFCNPITLEKTEIYVLFDYKNRNPFTLEARTVFLKEI